MSNKYIHSDIITPGQVPNPQEGGIQSSLQNMPLNAQWSPSTKTGSFFIFETDSGLINDGSGHVGSWLSVTNNVLANRVAGNLVPVQQNALNGRPATTWDTTGYLTIDSGTIYFTVGSPFSFYAVCSATAGAGTYYQTLIALKATSSQNFNIIVSNDPNYAPMYFGLAVFGGQTAIGATGTFVGGATQLIVINYNGGSVTNPTSWAVYQNNVSLSLASTTGTAAIGVNLDLLGSYSNNGPLPFSGWLGNIYEFGAYNSVFSTQELGFIETYSQRKWSTP